MIYVDEDINAIYCGETVEAAKLVMKKDAEMYFQNNPGQDTFSLCLVDWKNKVSTIYEFQQERTITCTVY